MDTNFRKWHWTQWLVALGFIYYIYHTFSLVYMVIGTMRFRITLMVLAGILINTYNLLNVYGLSVDYTLKRLLIPVAIPVGLIPLEMFLFYFLRKIEAFKISWSAMFSQLLVTAIMAGIFYLFHRKNEIITIPIMEKESDVQ